MKKKFTIRAIQLHKQIKKKKGGGGGGGGERNKKTKNITTNTDLIQSHRLKLKKKFKKMGGGEYLVLRSIFFSQKLLGVK